MAPQSTTATQTVPAEGDNVGPKRTSHVWRSLTELQVVYFHAGSKLSYRKVQSTPGGKGSFTSIPVIDVSQIDSASIEDRKAIARELYNSCSASGFFYIANHGVCLATDPPGETIEAH